MNAKQYIRYETPEAIYELYMAITLNPVSGLPKQVSNDPYKPLADRILADHGSFEAAQPILHQVHLLVKLESRIGNLRQRYPHLEEHEIVALFYDKVMSA